MSRPIGPKNSLQDLDRRGEELRQDEIDTARSTDQLCRPVTCTNDNEAVASPHLDRGRAAPSPSADACIPWPRKSD